MQRANDGSAGDVDYSRFASGYTDYRQPDPRIAALIEAALGDAVTVLNVGAGAGSYEPADRTVTAVEPSASMRAQRPPFRAKAIDATAETLPFEPNSFDAAMSTFSVHQWPGLEAGLTKVRSVAKDAVVIMSMDPTLLENFWLNDYAPEVMQTEARRFPTIERIADALGRDIEVGVVEIPLDCTDGFNQAYYGRPELLLDAGARRANSAWSFVGDDIEQRFVRDLSRDLDEGAWDEKYGYLRTTLTYDAALRLVVSR
jgi:hypothetical protein